MNPKRTISSIKREMGQNYHVEIDGKQLSPQLISSMILQKLLQFLLILTMLKGKQPKMLEELLV